METQTRYMPENASFEALPARLIGETLRTWPAIEHFLGVTRHTILSVGYPIRKSGGMVFAYKAELEEFYRQQPLINRMAQERKKRLGKKTSHKKGA